MRSGTSWQWQLDDRSVERSTRETTGQPMTQPTKKSNQKTAALYARYSSDIQNDRSIDDQFAICRTYAEREGLNVVKEFEFCDRAKSSATMRGRAGLRQLLEAARADKFEVLIVECFDRLSRDTEDLPGIYKRLSFAEIELHSLNEGIADGMKIGFRGIMGAAFLKDLADKVRRHHVARAKEGHVMGMVTYGYRCVAGKPGEREKDPQTAPIVHRIFAEYASGVKPREIAKGLTRDKIPSPSGADVWSHQTLLGGGGKSGLLRNPNYVGTLVYNRQKNVRDPDGGMTSRSNPERDHISTDVPHLRIIDQNLWDAAQANRTDRSLKMFGPGGIKRRQVVKRSDHLLSGMLRCGVCHEKMIFTSTSRGTQYVACAAWRNNSSCSHGKSYNIDLLQGIVAKHWREKLGDPRRHALAMKEARAEYAAQAKRDNADKEIVEAKIDRLTVHISRLADAIATGSIPIKEVMTSIEEKARERDGLNERLRLIKASNPYSNVRTMPHVADSYLEAVESVGTALNTNIITPDIIMAFRNLIDTIVVQPTGYKKGYEIDVFGRKSAYAGINPFQTRRSMEEILIDEAVSEKDRAAISAHLTGQVRQYHSSGNNVISLGRWKAAA